MLCPISHSLEAHLREDNGNPLQCSCLENPMDGGAWWAAVHGVVKSLTWRSDFTFTFRFHALEKEMATHSSVLAWRIPGMGELGGLPSMGLHRVGHDWSDLAAAEAHPWAIAVASIRVHGGLLVSGLSCILFLLLSALGFFLCSLWVKGCTCVHLKGTEFTTSRNLWPMKGESHEEILSSTLVSGGKFWGAFHMVLAGPPKHWDPIPTMIVSSTTLFLLLSCFALCIPKKILLEGCFPGRTQVKGTFYWISIGTQSSLYPIKIFLKFF